MEKCLNFKNNSIFFSVRLLFRLVRGLRLIKHRSWPMMGHDKVGIRILSFHVVNAVSVLWLDHNCVN